MYIKIFVEKLLIYFFGIEVCLFLKLIYLNNVYFKFFDESNEFVFGDDICIEWLLVVGFEVVIKYF